MITWNELKRQRNIKTHGIDFADCGSIFDFPLITKEDNRLDYGEQRLQRLGLLQGKVVFMVWVDRNDPHLISVRKATKHEQRYYFANTRF